MLDRTFLTLGVRKAVMLLLLAVVVACTPRPTAERGAPHEAASVERIFVVTQRPLDQLGPGFGAERSTKLNLIHADVSVPPTHKPGRIEWPEGPPDAATDFVMTGTKVYPRIEAMKAAMRADSADRETLLYVHGYNNTFSEALYRFAQIKADFEVESRAVMYSWPSAGDARGYIYDRDSILFALL